MAPAGPRPADPVPRPVRSLGEDRPVVEAPHLHLRSEHHAADEAGELIPRLEVVDDGPGVPRKYEAAIWQRFERGAHRFDTVTPGSGIGLPIAKALVEAHNGSIAYEPSDALGGASFVVKLPVSQAMDSVPA